MLTQAATRVSATIKSVAARAGVSTATVSRVLHSNGYVAPETRKRVEAALRESGYRLDAVAQALRRQRTITLGLILHGILPNPFFAEVAMGVEHAAVDHGFNVLIFNTDGDAEREREGVESLLMRRVDGVIFTTALRAENVQLALDAGIPAVEVERRLCESAGADVAQAPDPPRRRATSTCGAASTRRSSGCPPTSARWSAWRSTTAGRSRRSPS